MKDLDREPGFLLTVLMLAPLMAAVSVLCWLQDKAIRVPSQIKTKRPVF